MLGSLYAAWWQRQLSVLLTYLTLGLLAGLMFREVISLQEYHQICERYYDAPLRYIEREYGWLHNAYCRWIIWSEEVLKK